MDESFFDKYKNSGRKLGMAMAAYSSASIFGPLFIFGGLGWYLDKRFGSNPWLMLVGVFIAFIVTNILLFKKVVALTKFINKEKKTDETQNKDERGRNF